VWSTETRFPRLPRLLCDTGRGGLKPGGTFPDPPAGSRSRIPEPWGPDQQKIPNRKRNLDIVSS